MNTSIRNTVIPAWIIVIATTLSCRNQNNEVAKLQATIDSLQLRLNESYRPGFGELMSGIQLHHAKLWFAGQNKNWPLANFEIHEMKEGLEDIEKYCSDREETKSMKMIFAPLDSIETAVAQKDQAGFKTSYVLLTNTCNNCHKATAHEFNNVTIPTSPPISNQNFQPVQ